MRVNFSGVNLVHKSAPVAKVTNFKGNDKTTDADKKLQQSQELYQRALQEGWALPALNFSNLENLSAIVNAAMVKRSPLIVQLSEGARKYAGEDTLIGMVDAFRNKMQDAEVPLMLHLDHGGSFDIAKKCIDAGFDTIMIDGSKFGFDENARLTKEVVDYAHPRGVFVEAELGKLAGVEDAVSNKASLFTDPKEAAEFVRRTGADSLAISIGTSHGPVKFRPDEDPKLDFQRLSEIKKMVEAVLPQNKGKKPGEPGWVQYPFVLHGASSAPKDLVDAINANVVLKREELEKLLALAQKSESLRPEEATALFEAIKFYLQPVIGKGVPEEMYSEAVTRGIAKVNVDTDFRLGYTATTKGHLAKNPTTVDPRDYGKLVKAELQRIAERKMDMLNSSDKA